MADTLARMRQIVGTTAEWSTNPLVLADGEIGVERPTTGPPILRVGNGSTAFTGLSSVVPVPNTPAAFRARMTGNQSIPTGGAQTVVQYASEVLDEALAYNPATYTFTAPATRVFMLCAQVSVGVPGTGTGFLYLQLQVNGTGVLDASFAESGDYGMMTLAAPVSLAIGNTVRVVAINQTAQAVTLGQNGAGYFGAM